MEVRVTRVIPTNMEKTIRKKFRNKTGKEPIWGSNNGFTGFTPTGLHFSKDYVIFLEKEITNLKKYLVVTRKKLKESRNIEIEPCV